MSVFPLAKVTDTQLRQLCQVLWSWSLCSRCHNDQPCFTDDCPSQRSKRLMRFFEHYKDLTASYEPDVGLKEQYALTKHEDLFEIISQLKAHPDVPRAQLTHNIFADRASQRRPLPPPADQERAINLAVKVMIMVTCSAQYQSSDLLEHGTNWTPWQSDVSFSRFIEETFPLTDHPGVNDDNMNSFLDMKATLTARKLKKHARLNFRATNDLRNHLRLDRKNNVVDIYHHTAFLKEHLRLTKEKPRNLSVNDSLKL